MADAIFADGGVVGDDGSVRFAARLNVGDTSGSLFGENAVGVLDPFTVETHFIVRSHGPSRAASRSLSR